MTILTWCHKKIRSAYKTCKRVICCCTEDNEVNEINFNYAVHLHISEQQPSVRQMEANPASQQRRRPDIPTIKRLSVDPEKVAAVFRACKELRVPVGDDRDESCSDDDDDDGQKQTAGTPAAAAVDGRTTPLKVDKTNENSELS